MDSGYIKYNGEIIKVYIIDKHGKYLVVQTENNEILGIPPESRTMIWSTREECEAYECGCYFVPMGD